MLDLRGIPRMPVGTEHAPAPATSHASNPITRGLNWLVRGLGLQSQVVPNALMSEDVAPTIDVYQGGWATTPYSTFQMQVAGGSPTRVRTYVILPVQPTTAVLNPVDVSGLALVSCTMGWYNPVANEPSTPCGISLVTKFPPTSDPWDIGVVADLAVSVIPAFTVGAQAESVAWGTLVGNAATVLYAPPGYALAAWAEIGVADTWGIYVHGMYAAVPIRPRQ